MINGLNMTQSVKSAPLNFAGISSMLADIGGVPWEISFDPDASVAVAMADQSTWIILEGWKKLFLMPATSRICAMVDGAGGGGDDFVDRWMSCVL